MIKREPLSFIVSFCTAEYGYPIGVMLGAGFLYLLNFVKAIWTNFSVIKYYDFPLIDAGVMSVNIFLFAAYDSVFQALSSLAFPFGVAVVLRLVWLALHREGSRKTLLDASIICLALAALSSLFESVSYFLRSMLMFLYFVVDERMTVTELFSISSVPPNELLISFLTYLVMLVIALVIGSAVIAIIIRRRRLIAE